MKKLKDFIGESFRDGDKPAPADVQKHLGLKYANGHGGGDTEEKLSFAPEKSSLYMERGKIEGQDKVFAVQAEYTPDIDEKNASIFVCTATRPMSRTLTKVAFYTTDEKRAKRFKDDSKFDSTVEKVEKVVLCKDTDDLVTNIRNDYGKVTSYRNAGHGEEKDGVIYSAALKK